MPRIDRGVCRQEPDEEDNKVTAMEQILCCELSQRHVSERKLLAGDGENRSI